MKYTFSALKCVLILSTVFGAAVPCFAQDEQSTEVTGYYQQYRDFSFKTGIEGVEFPATSMTGGGFNIAQNLAPWFAMWTQLSIYGSVEQSDGLKLRIINNLQGIRYQTQMYGPARFYAKGGLGFSHYSIDLGSGSVGNYKFSFAYGGGAQIWPTEWLGITLDVSHVFMGVPNLTDLEGRDKWDSGLTYTPGITIKF